MADPEQPRQHFDEEGMEQLSESLSSFRQVTPSIVRIPPNAQEGKLILNDGERRIRSLKNAGIGVIWVVYDPIASTDCKLSQLVANFCREAHTHKETAKALHQLQNPKDGKALSLAEAAKAIGMKYQWAMCMNRLNNLEPTLLELTSKPTPKAKRIRLQVAFALAMIKEHADQVRIWNEIKKYSTSRMLIEIDKILSAKPELRRLTRGKKPSAQVDMFGTAIQSAETAARKIHTIPDEYLAGASPARITELINSLQLAQSLLKTQEQRLGTIRRKMGVEVPKIRKIQLPQKEESFTPFTEKDFKDPEG
jgi:ParB family chromosome partitioning protein